MAAVSRCDPLDLGVVGSFGRSATVFSSMPRARSENQNSRPLWNSSEAKIATSTVGTAAMTENSATSRVCSRPLPSPPCSARAIATRRDNSTISAIAGIRLATSSSAISGGDSSEPGLRRPLEQPDAEASA